MAQAPATINLSAHNQRKAVLQALFVTFLWSTSWVLIKIGLADIPALTFAGLRYSLAFLMLLPVFLHNGGRQVLRDMKPAAWGRLVLLGVVFYSLTQGAQFVGLAYLPAVTVNLLLSLTTVVVALLSMVLLSEHATGWQWLGIFVAIGGALLYFYPIQIPASQAIGWAAVITGVLANAGSAVLGRAINRRADLPPLAVTVISMGVGSTILLAAGILAQGLPQLSLLNWLIVLWLAGVNTAFAFTLWNLTQRTLSAAESSMINNTMLIQIPLLAVIFLGETLHLQELAGLALAGLGMLGVQLGRARPKGRLRR
jgi:drug/metabolite transporter (DMT)-like permease